MSWLLRYGARGSAALLLRRLPLSLSLSLPLPIRAALHRSALRLITLLTLSFGAAGCEGETPAAPGGRGDLSVADQRVDMAVDQRPPDRELIDPTRALLQRVAFIEARLTPRRTFYPRSERPQLELTLSDRYGDPLDVPLESIRVQPRPEGCAALDAEGRLTFLTEGAGALRICSTPEVCGRVSFIVDDGPPTLSLDEPAEGLLIEGAPQPIIVAGRAEGHRRLLVNEALVETDGEGRFRVELPARFGYNPIEVVADDGIHRPAPRILRTPLYAPRLQEMGGGEGAPLSPALQLSVGAEAFDDGQRAPRAPEEMPEPDEQGGERVLTRGSVAGLLTLLLERLHLDQFLSARVLADDEEIRFEINEVSLIDPLVELTPSEAGLDLFLSLPTIRLGSAGRTRFEGVEVNLGGEIEVGLAAFALLQPSLDGALLQLSLEELGVSLSRLRGRLQDENAQALLDTFGGLLQGLLRGAAAGLAEGLLREALSAQLSAGFELGFSALEALDFTEELSPEFGTLSLSLELSLDPPRLDAEGLHVSLSGSLSSPVDERIAALPLPVHERSPLAPLEGAPLLAAIPLEQLNLVLYRIWRQGLLERDLSSLIPEAFQGLVSTLRLSSPLPPLLSPPAAPGEPFRLTLSNLELTLEGLNSGPDQHRISLDAAAQFSFEEGAAQLRFEERPTLRFEQVSQGAQRPVLPPELLSDSLQALLWPQLDGLLEGGLRIPLPNPQLPLDALGLAPGTVLEIGLALEEARFQDGWIRLTGRPALRLVEARAAD